MTRAVPRTVAKRLAQPPISEDERADALVMNDALLQLGGRHTFSGHELRMLSGVVAAARREYLRHFPMADDLRPRSEHIMVSYEGVSVGGRSPIEYVWYCNFCREPIASLGNDGTRRLPASWTHKLDRHTDGCAVAIVLGPDHPLGMAPVGQIGWRRSKPAQRGGYTAPPTPVKATKHATKRNWPAPIGPG